MFFPFYTLLHYILFILLFKFVVFPHLQRYFLNFLQMANSSMDVDQILGNNEETTLEKASKKGEKSKTCTIASAIDCTKKECQIVRETMINIHDKIREAMAEMRQQLSQMGKTLQYGPLSNISVLYVI